MPFNQYNCRDPYNCHIRKISERAERERENIRMNLVVNQGDIDRLNRLKERGTSGGLFKENDFRVNKIKFFKDIPDGVEILIDYVDVTALRMMTIPTEIIYESIYRELPELFEE